MYIKLSTIFKSALMSTISTLFGKKIKVRWLCPKINARRKMFSKCVVTKHTSCRQALKVTWNQSPHTRYFKLHLINLYIVILNLSFILNVIITPTHSSACNIATISVWVNNNFVENFKIIWEHVWVLKMCKTLLIRNSFQLAAFFFSWTAWKENDLFFVISILIRDKIFIFIFQVLFSTLFFF